MTSCTVEPARVRNTRTTSPRTSSPRFIVLEGLDGSGKSTLAAALATRLEADLLSTPLNALRPVRADVDRVFGDTGLARALWYAAHVAKASELAAERLAGGRSLVLDRYWMSTLAYAACQGLSLELTEWRERLTKPDVTLLLTVPRALRLARLLERQEGSQPHDRQFLAPDHESCLYASYRRLGRDPHAGRFLEVEVHDHAVDRNVDRLLEALRTERGVAL